MRSGSKRSRKPAQFVERPSELSGLLADLRKAKGLSLREVEEAADNAVSNAYLSQLENGKIGKPSPNVLQSLAEVYGVPYDALMERAGYLLPPENGSGRRTRLEAFAIDDLTADEEQELLRYLAFLRSRTSRHEGPKNLNPAHAQPPQKPSKAGSTATATLETQPEQPK